MLDRDIAEGSLEDEAIRRLLTGLAPVSPDTQAVAF